MQSGLQQQALSQQMQQFMAALQFQQQQAALQQGMNYATQFGAAPGGNWMTWGAGGPTQPTPGTYTQAAQQQAFAQGQSAAGLTGYYSNPQTWAYPPGTYVRNNQTGQVGQVQGGGQLVTTGNLPPGLDVSTIPGVDQGEFTSLQQGQGGGAGGGYSVAPTQAAVSQAQQLAAQQAGLTGMYTQPMGNIAQDAWAKASPQTQQSYLQNTQGDVNTAANRYWNDVQGAIQQSGMTPQQFVYGTTGPTPTMALQQMYGTYGTPTADQQTLQAINQAAQLSGMYQGAPTEAAREYNQTLALQQGQLGQQYLSTAAQLQGPQNTFQLSNYLRGAQGNPNVPVYLQNLGANIGTPAFQATGTTAPTPNTIGGLQQQMGGANTNYYTGDQTGQGATNSFTAAGQAPSGGPGWDYNQTLNQINQIAQRGAQGLAPGSLERLTPDELSAFGSGLGAAGYSLPSFMSQYAASRVGQQAPTAMTSLAA